MNDVDFVTGRRREHRAAVHEADTTAPVLLPARTSWVAYEVPPSAFEW